MTYVGWDGREYEDPERYANRDDCTHEDERGPTVLQATGDRWECIVCGQRFKLTPYPAPAVTETDLTNDPTGLEVVRDGAWDAMNAALSRTFPIYDDPEAGTDIDGDVNAMTDALRDYGTGYIVVSIDRLRAALAGTSDTEEET